MASNQGHFDVTTLPALAAERIASFLSGRDLIKLGSTCKFWHEIERKNFVWKQLVQERFGKAELVKSTETDFKRLYFMLARSRMPVADFHNIVHLNGEYLAKTEDPESTFGSVIHLKSVCWLQMNGTFRAVLPGKYRFLWRLKLSNAFMHCTNGDYITYKAIPEVGCGAELCCQWSEEIVGAEERQHGTNKWFVADMGELCVESKCDVNIEIHGRVDWWCGGFFWDYVQLKPVETFSDESQDDK